MEFCDQVCPLNCTKSIFFATTTKSSIDVEGLHFKTFSSICRKCKIGQRDGHGKSRNSHGIVIEKSWNNILSVESLQRKLLLYHNASVGLTDVIKF